MTNGQGTEVCLYALDTGLIECTDYAMFSPNAGPGVYREMSVRSYLVVHPAGTLLWDTGIDDAIAELAGGKRIADPIVFRVPRTLRSQLAEIGVAPDEVDYLGLSHLHVDHVGNAGLFPGATVLMQLAEYEAGYCTGDRTVSHASHVLQAPGGALRSPLPNSPAPSSRATVSSPRRFPGPQPGQASPSRPGRRRIRAAATGAQRAGNRRLMERNPAAPVRR